ncbi:DUF4105 domain-containing protein [Pseudomonadota bacterium]
MASFFLFLSIPLCNASLFGGNASLSGAKTFDPLIWNALLHYRNNKLYIEDENFVLSGSDFSPQNEWNATLLAFQENPSTICRFPARFIYMSSVLPPGTLIETPLCPGFEEFLRKAPAEEISIVYASENLTNPSSMMGHGMLALEGARDDGRIVRHSVSFFTELDSLNPFDVIWETLIVGKAGYFLVKPLRNHYEFYNLHEQRNVWKYVLNLSAKERQLVQAHLWELKFPDLQYLFHEHNCATLTLDILRTVRPSLSASSWVSPIDLAKAVHKEGMIASSEVTPSAKWRVRMLTEISNKDIAENVREWSHGTEELKDVGGTDEYLQHQLAYAVLEYGLQTGILSKKEKLDKQVQLDGLGLDTDAELDLAKYRSPLKTPEDSQISVGWLRSGDERWMTIDWLPASHGIEDDNRQYFSENELRLSDVSLKLSLDEPKVKLHRWQLYSARSLTPRESVTGGLSGGFRVGFYSVYNKLFQEQLNFEISGGLGVTYAFGADFRLYSLLNLGGFYRRDNDGFYLEPELGGYLYEIWDMKSWLRYKPRITNTMNTQHKVLLTHTLSFHGSAIILDAEYLRQKSRTRNSTKISWRYYF